MHDALGPMNHSWLAGLSIDTVFTTFVTIGIFILGYLANRIYDDHKEKRRLKDIREYVICLLTSIIPAIDKQLSGFRGFTQQISSKQHQDYVFIESTSLNFEGLDSLPRNDIFMAFTKGRKSTRTKRIEQFNSLFGAIDFIRHQKRLARDSFIRFNEAYHRYLTTWNKNIDLILRSHDEYIMMARRASVPPSKDPFLKGFNSLVHQLAESPESRQWDILKSKFLEPLLLICKTNSVDPRAIALMKIIIQADYAYDNRDQLFASYGSYFEQQVGALSEKRDSLAASLKAFGGEVQAAIDS